MERIFAACAPGLESLLAAELSALGLAARAVPGGAEAEGEDAAALACLASRLAEAVKLRAGGRSRDAAGAPLYRRGWRARVGAAPLRETLAAAMLAAAGWEGETPFLDPMCGSGTIAIEAALVAVRRAPGLARRFACESWPGRDAARIAALRERLAGRERSPPAPLCASDRNGGAVRLAARNAEAAGVARHLRIARREAAEVDPPPGPGLLAVNPPWGSRLEGDPAPGWDALAALLTRLPGWTAVVLAPERGLEKRLGRSPARVLETRAGGKRCRLLLYPP